MAHWKAQRVERDAPADELGSYAESFQRMAHLWSVTTPEDKQILIRSLFESVYYDMDTRQIIDFQLKPGADRYLIARFALYEDERCQTDKGVAIPDAPASQRHFFGWSVLCPEGGFNPDPAPRLRWHQRASLDACIWDRVHPMCLCLVKHPAKLTATQPSVHAIWRAKLFPICP